MALPNASSPAPQAVLAVKFCGSPSKPPAPQSSAIVWRTLGRNSNGRAARGASLRPDSASNAGPGLATPAGPTGDSRLSAARTGFGWSASAPDLADPAAQQRRALDRVLNISALAALGIFGVSKLVENEAGLWQLYQQAVTTSPIEAKACISGMVYSVGDLIAQGYEGRDVGDWDRGRAVRSGVCGLLAHGPLSHLYYVGLDHFFAQQVLLPPDSWAIPVVKIAVDQTVWSLAWNSCYYVLLGLLKLESPATIAQTVRNSWWDLLKAGWRLWPLVHIFTYGVIPVQHRLLFVDTVELAWVSILSAYAQQQRQESGVVACALPGSDGEGGDAAEEILRGMQVEREIVFEDALGNRTVASPADVYAAAAALAARRRSSSSVDAL